MELQRSPADTLTAVISSNTTFNNKRTNNNNVIPKHINAPNCANTTHILDLTTNKCSMKSKINNHDKNQSNFLTDQKQILINNNSRNNIILRTNLVPITLIAIIL